MLGEEGDRQNRGGGLAKVMGKQGGCHKKKVQCNWKKVQGKMMVGV